MTRLGKIQAEFARALQEKTPLSEGSPGFVFAEREIRGDTRLGSPFAHVEVYREQFGLRHRGSLAEDFPALGALLGADAFDALLADYLAAHPPAHYSLLYAGNKLSEFLGRTLGAAALEAELAAFEYALVALAEVADAPPLSLDAVSAVPDDAWPAVALVFQPALTLLSFAHPVHRVRMDADQGKPTSRPQAADTWIAIARAAFGVPTYLELDKRAFFLLTELLRGLSIGDATRKAATKLGIEVSLLEEPLPAWFQNWIAWGWVSRLELPTGGPVAAAQQ